MHFCNYPTYLQNSDSNFNRLILGFDRTAIDGCIHDGYEIFYLISFSSYTNSAWVSIVEL